MSCFRLSLLAVYLFMTISCAIKVEPLMPTPLIYSQSDVGPLDHVPKGEQYNLREVFYVTTREREKDVRSINYINEESDEVSIGLSMVGFGGYDMTWEDLNRASSTFEREDEVKLSIAGIMEAGRFNIAETSEVLETKGAAVWLMESLDTAIERARDKDILIYVHGAKVNFYNASAFAAQLDHFMGRDMTSIAFSWPTRQNIVAYASGGDVKRAYRSAPALTSTIRMLAENTRARKINIITWSAGGRLVTSALSQLHALEPDLTAQQLREKYRLGTIYYAASDVPRGEFIESLPAINDLVDRVIVTASANDDALKSAKLFMGGDARIGQYSKEQLSKEQAVIIDNADRLEYIDMSSGSEIRGFDITGHRYWFNHPWASSDVLIAIRSDYSAVQRGLEQGDHPALWSMPTDYPERIRDISLHSRKTLRNKD